MVTAKGAVLVWIRLEVQLEDKQPEISDNPLKVKTETNEHAISRGDFVPDSTPNDGATYNLMAAPTLAVDSKCQ